MGCRPATRGTPSPVPRPVPQQPRNRKRIQAPKNVSVADLSLVGLKQNLHIFRRPTYGAR